MINFFNIVNSFKKNKNAKIRTKSGEEKTLHSVLLSNIFQNIDGEVKSINRYQNRNKNAVLNFKVVVDCYKETGIRKPKFSRSTKLDEDDEVEEVQTLDKPKKVKKLGKPKEAKEIELKKPKKIKDPENTVKKPTKLRIIKNK